MKCRSLCNFTILREWVNRTRVFLAGRGQTGRLRGTLVNAVLLGMAPGFPPKESERGSGRACAEEGRLEMRSTVVNGDLCY